MTPEEKIIQITQSFRKVNQAFYKQMRSNADDLGVTTLQLYILRLLDEEPHQGLVEMAKKLSSSKSTISETVERLVKLAYIKRERSTKDRRVLVMTLTDLGKEKKTEAYHYFIKRLSGLEGMSQESVEKLLKLHEQIYNEIKLDGDE